MADPAAALQKRCVPLMRGAVERDAAAWHSFWIAVAPSIDAVAASPTVTGRLARSLDDRRNISTAVMAKLREDDFRRLRAFLDALETPGTSLVAWLRVVTIHVARDYVRVHAEYRRSGSSDRRWVEIVPLPDSEPPASSRDSTRIVAALQVLGEARRALTPEQLAALLLWLRAATFAEIAAELGLPDGREAERRVRSALARLREKYAGGGPAANERRHGSDEPSGALEEEGPL